MFKRLGMLVDELRRRIHSFALGTTLALGVILLSQLGQSCAISGQCASCGACVPKLLPILGLPLVADGVLMLVAKLQGRSVDREATVRESLPREEG